MNNEKKDISFWMEKFFAQESCDEEIHVFDDFSYTNIYRRILGSLK